MTMESILSELRLAARSLRRTPAITIAALITLAIGIGANSAVFSVVDGRRLVSALKRTVAAILANWLRLTRCFHREVLTSQKNLRGLRVG
jgi:hypothetical protein